MLYRENKWGHSYRKMFGSTKAKKQTFVKNLITEMFHREVHEIFNQT